MLGAGNEAHPVQKEYLASRHWSGWISKQFVETNTSHLPRFQVLSSLDTLKLFWQILPPISCARFSHLSQAAGESSPAFISGTRIFSSEWWSCYRGSAYESNILPDGLIKQGEDELVSLTWNCQVGRAKDRVLERKGHIASQECCPPLHNRQPQSCLPQINKGFSNGLNSSKIKIWQHHLKPGEIIGNFLITGMGFTSVPRWLRHGYMAGENKS